MSKNPQTRIVWRCCYVDPSHPQIEGLVAPDTFLTEEGAVTMGEELVCAGYAVGIFWCREVRRDGHWEIDFTEPPPRFFEH